MKKIKWGDEIEPGTELKIGFYPPQNFVAWSFGPHDAAHTLITTQGTSVGANGPGVTYTDDSRFYRTWDAKEFDIVVCTCQPKPICGIHG